MPSFWRRVYNRAETGPEAYFRIKLNQSQHRSARSARGVDSQHSLLQVAADGHARAYREENWLMADHSLGLEKNSGRRCGADCTRRQRFRNALKLSALLRPIP